MNDEQYNLNSRAPEAQQTHDFIHNSRLPLGYFDSEKNRRGWLIAVLVFVGLIVIGSFGLIR